MHITLTFAYIRQPFKSANTIFFHKLTASDPSLIKQLLDIITFSHMTKIPHVTHLTTNNTSEYTGFHLTAGSVSQNKS